MIIASIAMDGLADAPIYSENPWDKSKMLDFNKIIPVGNTVDPKDLKKAWGTTGNTIEPEIESESIITFKCDGLPMPIITRLSKMYPQQEVYFGYWDPTSGEDPTHITMRNGIRISDPI